jgi:hypothetical protein
MPQILQPRIPDFLSELEAGGVKVERGSAKVGELKPTQAEIHVEHVREMLEKVPEANLRKAVIVSSDGYVLDGHHRWAALHMKGADEEIATIEVGLPIRKLLDVARGYSGVTYKDEAEHADAGTSEGAKRAWESRERAQGEGKAPAVKSGETWSDFADRDPSDRKLLRVLKREQIAYERNGGAPGTRYDVPQKGRQPPAAAARTEVSLMGGVVGAFVLERGAEHPLPAKPPAIRLGEPKRCFQNAGELAIDDDSVDYAEGYLVSSRLPFPIQHAWAVDRKTGTVVDPTMGFDPSSRYFGVTLDKATLLASLMKNKVWGVLTTPAGTPTPFVTGKGAAPARKRRRA